MKFLGLQHYQALAICAKGFRASLGQAPWSDVVMASCVNLAVLLVRVDVADLFH
jgi:hypothetical protein